jgi:hypothetical protein
VIAEVDEAVRALVRSDALDGTDVEVVFDAPTKDWAARRNAPTVNMYLYDIREDLKRRARGQVNEYDQRGYVVSRHLPPRHFRLSYLVTAWTQRPEDEHRLLAALLSCFVRHDNIPDGLLTGPLRMGLPVGLTVALPPPEDRSFADVWSALGGELKPSLDLVVSAPIDIGQHYPAGPPVQEPTIISLEDRQGDAQSRRQARRVPAGARPPGAPVGDTDGGEVAAVPAAGAGGAASGAAASGGPASGGSASGGPASGGAAGGMRRRRSGPSTGPR